MGWASGTNHRGREVGYAIEALCDRPGCGEHIDRGLGTVCGGMHDGGAHGCGRYFCGEHLFLMPYLSSAYLEGMLCDDCVERWMDVIGVPGFLVDYEPGAEQRIVMHRNYPVGINDEELVAGPPACGATVPLMLYTGDADMTLFYPWCIPCWQVDTVKEVMAAALERQDDYIDGLYAASGIA